MSFSQIQLLGNVGKDPELTVTSDGTPLTKFSLAVSKKSKSGEDTQWYNCTAWRTLAETIEKYVTKGQMLFVQGELNLRTYTTKDGKTGFSMDVTVEKFAFAGGKKPENGSSKGDPFLPEDL